ncbi:hypothetical protein DUNSADRAFT_2585 [Dunaliella salina]|uniref:Repulsive guidance molecule C-terminal domain-containing protein n=1 Tax=Dunaliella salina TaxID=3046 RepID=A0ABQ7FW46_DUNSA|nr:hypothetical protein DUNSADRAFT_2585 [Dunaliella salina]|eukprot:KAF5826596.1 hypothetical protein DUNSADRAFT_2585 [Dunaliella salina]
MSAFFFATILLYFTHEAVSDRHDTITKECLERFIAAYSDRFTSCRECFQASEDENANDSIWDCCDPQRKNCGEIFPHLQYVIEPCTEEDKQALHLEELKETGNVWESMCKQVNAEPIKSHQPPPPLAPSAAGSQKGGVAISLNVPPSPPVTEDGDKGSDADQSNTHIACTPAFPEDSFDICLVHGDPHVMGFSYVEGSMHTCDSVGRVELLSNQFISVKAEAQYLSQTVPSSNVTGASILTSLTISYKNESCGSDQQISSATKWEDARLQTSVTVNEDMLQSGQRFLSVRIATPFISGSSGWCKGGCPEQEVPTGPSRNFARKRLLQGNEGGLDPKAFEACRAEGLQGDFMKACAFDTSYSGDKAFVASASREAAEFAAVKYGKGDVQTSRGTAAKKECAVLMWAVAVLALTWDMCFI